MRTGIRSSITSFVVATFLLTPHAYAQAVTPDTIGRAIGAFFPDAPHMVAIARCESGLRQYDANGRALRGGWGNKMIGLFQFHETYHRAAALARGYDIDTLLGNILYARTVYANEGTTPWNSSKHCWETYEIKNKIEDTQIESVAIPLVTQAVTLTKTLRYGMTDPEVEVLQQKLSAAGFPVVPKGEETPYFGIATYKALLAFQCSQEIACLSKPDMRNGLGVVNSATRAALLTF